MHPLIPFHHIVPVMSKIKLYGSFVIACAKSPCTEGNVFAKFVIAFPCLSNKSVSKNLPGHHETNYFLVFSHIKQCLIHIVLHLSIIVLLCPQGILKTIVESSTACGRFPAQGYNS